MQIHLQNMRQTCNNIIWVGCFFLQNKDWLSLEKGQLRNRRLLGRCIHGLARVEKGSLSSLVCKYMHGPYQLFLKKSVHKNPLCPWVTFAAKLPTRYNSKIQYYGRWAATCYGWRRKRIQVYDDLRNLVQTTFQKSDSNQEKKEWLKQGTVLNYIVYIYNRSAGLPWHLRLGRYELHNMCLCIKTRSFLHFGTSVETFPALAAMNYITLGATVLKVSDRFLTVNPKVHVYGWKTG